MSQFYTVTTEKMSAGAVSANRSGHGLVTVLVACCGQLEYTRHCVPRLLRFSRHPFELIFLDLESLDGTSEYLEGFAAGAPVRVETSRVRAEPDATETRADETVSIRGDYVALLNNDIIVTEQWLDSMINVACSATDIGMVAPMCNVASPIVMDSAHVDLDMASVCDSRRGKLTELGKVDAFAKEWANAHRSQWLEVDTLFGGCALMKREALQKIGQFPARTALGSFDTQKLSSHVRQAGFKLAACKEAFVYSFSSRGC